MSQPRRIWLTLEGPDVVEMKQVVLDRDPAGAVAFFRRTVVSRVREAARRRGLLPGQDGSIEEKDGRVPG